MSFIVVKKIEPLTVGGPLYQVDGDRGFWSMVTALPSLFIT
jgi:hypothetical protein